MKIKFPKLMNNFNKKKEIMKIKYQNQKIITKKLIYSLINFKKMSIL